MSKASKNRDLISYVLNYGGRCRSCADEDGICPKSYMPCASADKAVQFVLDALKYGMENGFIPPFPAALAAAEAKGVKEGMERCAQSAVELVRKWGDPNGSDYEQGAQDMGHRIVAAIQAFAKESPND